jgi:hypothetical protein
VIGAVVEFVEFVVLVEFVEFAVIGAGVGFAMGSVLEVLAVKPFSKQLE